MATPRNAKVTMGEIKLRRLEGNISHLRSELSRHRILVSLASQHLINHCRETRDPLLPSLWGQLGRGEDHYAPVEQRGCCVVM